MNIAIIGAGFTGLSAAYQLTKLGCDVTVFEKNIRPGGLALGFKNPGWEWSLETHYHHWFVNDKTILNFAKELEYDVIIKRPKTSIYLDGLSYQLDSPMHLLKLPKLSYMDKLRMAFALGLLRYNPFWKPLERFKADTFLNFFMGETSYQTIWEPQMKNKFGQFAKEISLAWFWARIKKRTAELAYPKGGYLSFATHIANLVKNQGGKLLFGVEVTEIKSDKKINISYFNKNHEKIEAFDACIVSLPSFIFQKIAPQLPVSYTQRLSQLKGLGAINLILRLRNQFLTDGAYWLSICDTSSPVMAIVEHTNFMDKKYYNNEHIVYLGGYFLLSHPYFKMGKEELLKIYDPFLQKIHPNYQLSIINFQLFKTPFAQPIIPTYYSRIMPPFETPLKNIYLANIQQVYPWDRGTNHAVELGEKAAELISKR